MCLKHIGESMKRERETVDRIARNSDLRATFLVSLLQKQGGCCVDPMGRCPWTLPLVVNGVRRLPHDAAELDHKVPLADGGTDDESNLQVLCACCHSMKTHAERAALRILASSE